jgi:carbonic anhydrase
MRDWKPALVRLEEGNARFRNDAAEHRFRDSARRRELASGQSPFAAVLTCADSRVVPELAFDAGLGELFVVSVAGNIATPGTIASLEYAVDQLRVPLVVVMGHESCGAVAAALQGVRLSPHLDRLTGLIAPAIAACATTEPDDVSRENVRQAVAAIQDGSPIIGKATRVGEARIVGAFYELVSGRVIFDVD